MPNIKSISFIILLALFIYPSAAKPPKSIFNECPAISVECPASIFASKETAKFSAVISGNGLRTDYTYRWTISVGTITNGQNTSQLTVDGTGFGGHSMTASVEVGGLPEGCPNAASCTTSVAYVHCCRLFDMYGKVPFKREKERLNNFAIQLTAEPDKTGHIIVYGGRRTYIGEAKERAGRIRNYLTSERGLDPEKIKIEDGGYREESTVELWIIAADTDAADAPTASPTVEANQVQIIRDNGKARKRKRLGRR